LRAALGFADWLANRGAEAAESAAGAGAAAEVLSPGWGVSPRAQPGISIKGSAASVDQSGAEASERPKQGMVGSARWGVMGVRFGGVRFGSPPLQRGNRATIGSG
jgi:hypothetical protein